MLHPFSHCPHILERMGRPTQWLLTTTYILHYLSALRETGGTEAFTDININNRYKNGRHCTSTRSIERFSSADNAVTEQGVDDDNDKLEEWLGLTVEEAAHVRQRCQAIHNNHNRTRTSNSSRKEVLTWLSQRFFDMPPSSLQQSASASPIHKKHRETLSKIVLGHPPVLSYDIPTNVAPTIAFYQDALHCNASAVSEFLVQSPQLLEYNVRKRLLPRLERWYDHSETTTMRDGASLDDSARLLDEDGLRALATKTDSRFDEWLRLRRMVLLDSDAQCTKNSSDASLHQPTTRISTIDPHLPSAYVIVSNLQSGANIGNILRSACIFGCHEIVVVGQSRFRLTGDHGARFALPHHHVWSHAAARAYLVEQKRVRLYGVEIVDGAVPLMRYNRTSGVTLFPFRDDGNWTGAAFLMGNEGQGLSAKQREICDEFLYIPQPRGGTSRSGGAASLNVASAATVVLQAYAMWAGYSDAARGGEKFVDESS